MLGLDTVCIYVGKYTFIITEKPDAARRIASALDRYRNAKRVKEKGVPYYLARHNTNLVVVPALGHLYTISSEKNGRTSYPVFDYKWVPRYAVERKSGHIKKWLEIIMKLAQDADEFVDACDYDIEGSVIGYHILKYACGGKENVARRMKFSTLIEEELEKAYTESLPHLDFALIEAGQTRHEIDWLYGINLSRALTVAVKKWSGKYWTLSTGRVQGPLLKFLVSRETNIRSFVPTPFWKIKAKLQIKGRMFTAKFGKRAIETWKEAYEISTGCKGKGQIEKVATHRFEQSPPVPFDTGTLQVEAYKLFGFSPQKTLDIAQRLYLDALISYPRTSSQRLPSGVDFKAILHNLGSAPKYEELAAKLLTEKELKPIEGIREDSAHPAIYPTGKLPERLLDKSEASLWDLVVRRFMAACGEPATRQSIKAKISINNRVFYLNGRQTTRRGWQQFYGCYTDLEETPLPPLSKGQMICFKKVIVEPRFTKPPSRYNPSSLLVKMEEAGIGTKATRANTIQTLYKRKYVRDERMTVTELGFQVLDVLESHCRQIVSVEMTKELEGRINQIAHENEKGKAVLADAIRTLGPMVKELEQNKLQIGKQLSNALKTARLNENIIGACPNCRTGKLFVIYSKTSGKRFVGCTNYFTGVCRTSFVLPQKGIIRPNAGQCDLCGWPSVQVQMRRKTRVLCFNPDCKSKESKRQN